MNRAWQKEELNKIATTDDFHISPFRKDDKTCGTPTWIWSVVVDETVYARARGATVKVVPRDPKQVRST